MRLGRFHALRMSLRDSMFVGRIVWLPLDRAELAFAADPFSDLVLNFTPSATFERIGASDPANHPCDHGQHHQRLHLCILGSRRDNAIADWSELATASLRPDWHSAMFTEG